jgi:hypothetical protein
MSEFLDFVKGWAKMIGGVFGDYPLAAALITLVAVVAFMIMEHRARPSNWTTRTYHFFIVLIGWAIAVPILGFVFGLIEKILGLGKGALNVLAFLYGAYEKHPLVVLMLLVVCVGTYFVWHFMRPKSPSRILKAVACAALLFVSVAVSKPIAGLFSPSEATPPTPKPVSLPAPAPAQAPASTRP